MRVLLYLLRSDGRVRTRALKWLRCEDLSQHDREVLGGLVPRPQDGMPLKTIVGLGRLMAVIHSSALVLCVDQLEEMIQDAAVDAKPGELFRRAVDFLVAVTEEVPTAVVVLACLEDYYIKFADYLTKPKLDRLARDPEAIRLSSQRGIEELTQMIAKRLEVLYSDTGAAIDPASPIFPYNTTHVQKLSGLRTRDFLDFIRQHHETCVLAQRWINPIFPDEKSGKKEAAKDIQKEKQNGFDLEKRWSDHLALFQAPPLEDESYLASLIAWSVQATSAEMPDGMHFAADPEGRMVPVEAHGPGNDVEKLLVAVCERSPKGGGLGKQVQETAKKAGEIPAIFVRSTPFPVSPTTVVSKLLANLVAPVGKGRRVVVQNTDWRGMAAFREFQEKEQAQPDFSAWQMQSRPLSNLKALRKILNLENRLSRRQAVASTPTVPTRASARGFSKTSRLIHPATGNGGRRPSAPGCLSRHEPNTGDDHPARADLPRCLPGRSRQRQDHGRLEPDRTTFVDGVPAVLVDRKGDLCRYADFAAWDEPIDTKRAQRRRMLRDRLDVALFTPGGSRRTAARLADSSRRSRSAAGGGTRATGRLRGCGACRHDGLQNEGAGAEAGDSRQGHRSARHPTRRCGYGRWTAAIGR